MSRHNRHREHPAPNPVSSYPVAPHRYTWDGAGDVDGSSHYDEATEQMVPPLSEFLKASPYKAGEVVWIAYGSEARLAFIADVFHDYDGCGDRRHKYRVHMANVRGDRFAKTWFYTWPGMVQRGYARAGLAPDIPAHAR